MNGLGFFVTSGHSVVRLGTFICACKINDTRSVKAAASHGFAEFRLSFLFCLLLHSVPYTVNAFHITLLDPDLSSVLLTTLCENMGVPPLCSGHFLCSFYESWVELKCL